MLTIRASRSDRCAPVVRFRLIRLFRFVRVVKTCPEIETEVNIVLEESDSNK